MTHQNKTSNAFNAENGIIPQKYITVMQKRKEMKRSSRSIVDRIVVIVPRFTQWTGTRAMHEGDFAIGTGGQLPPKEVAKSLGLKAIIDTQHLRVFDRIKHKAEAVLDACGVRYLSGWAIPEDKADEVFKALDELVESYSRERAGFLNRYDALVKQWADQNPGFAKEIMDGKLDVNAVSERISAGYESFRLQPVSAKKAAALAQSIGGLADELIASVTRTAKIFFKESFLGKTRANRKTVNAVLKIRQKLQGLAFLSSSILPVIAFIDKVVDEMPSEGYFSGEPFWKLAALVKTLADAALLEEIMNDPAYAAAAFPADGGAAAEEDAESSSLEGLNVESANLESSAPEAGLELDVPEADANPHLPFGESNESLNPAGKEGASESLDLQGFAKDVKKEQDLLRDLDELFDTPNSQGKMASERAPSTAARQDPVGNSREETAAQAGKSDAEVEDERSGNENAACVEVPAVDVGEGLYF